MSWTIQACKETPELETWKQLAAANTDDLIPQSCQAGRRWKQTPLKWATV